MGHRLWTAILLGCLPLALHGAVKLKLVEGYPYVDVSINSRGPFRMLIDTGDSSSSITPETAKAAGVEFDQRVPLTTMSGEQAVPAAADIAIRVGTVETELPAVLAAKPEAIRRLDSKAAGVLGQGFLSRFPYLIDYRRKLLWIGDEAVAESQRLGPPIPTRQVRGMILLPARIGPASEPAQLALDSGAPHLILQCRTRCAALDSGREVKLVTNTGHVTAQTGHLGRVRLGETVFPEVEAVILRGTPPVDREDGVLPAKWFSAVYVDSERHVVRVTR